MKLRNLATIYIFNDDKVLLIHRVGSRLFNGPIWAGIGGHFEKDELNDPKACVIRELFKETGIDESMIKDLSLNI